MKNVTMIIALMMVFAVSAADTWYVDASKSAGSGDGKSPATAFHTIQEAVNAAAVDDTVIVLPGVYDEGSMVGQSSTGNNYKQHARVKIARRITLKSRDGRESVHIVGKYNGFPGETDGNDTTNTIQCVWIDAAAKGTVIEGVTLRGGSCCTKSSGAGAIGVADGAAGADCFVLAYSTVSNCVSKYGAMRYGFAFGTEFFDNHSADGSAITEADAVNCIIHNNDGNGLGTSTGGGSAVKKARHIVNCSIINNRYGRGVTGSQGPLYNVALFANGKQDDKTAVCTNCVWDWTDTVNWAGAVVSAESERMTILLAASKTGIYTNLVMSSCTGDMRPLKGGFLDEKGDRSFLSLDFIPEAYRNRDYYGNQLAVDAKIPIGAVLPAAEPVTAPVRFTTDLTVNGMYTATRNQVHLSDKWPSQLYLEGNPTDGGNFAGFTFAGEVSGFFDAYTLYRSKYNGCWMTVPPRENVDGVTLPDMTITRRTFERVIWVERNAKYTGEADGSEERPYLSIQAAVRTLVNKKFTCIRVKPGIYDNEFEIDPEFGVRTRVSVPAQKYVMIIAEEGPENTIIEGAPDPDTLNDEESPGFGKNAVRCVYAASSATFGLCGFTIRNGYCWKASESVSADSKGVLSVHASKAGASAFCGRGQNQHLYDCIITGNHIPEDCTVNGVAYQNKSTPINNGWIVRCLVTGNTGCRYGATMNATHTACVFAKNADANSTVSTLYSSSKVFSSTVFEPDAADSVPMNSNNNYLYNIAIANAGYVTSLSDETQGDCNYAYRIDRINNVQNIGVYKNPMLSAPGARDFRPTTGSPLIGGGTMVSKSEEKASTGMILRNTAFDFNNQPLVNAADGSVFAGAVASIREGVKNVYISPDGDDDNDGFTEESPKKTFVAAFAIANDGADDKVVALPGVYGDAAGASIHTGYWISSRYPVPFVRSRVCVPEGMTLVSRDGAAATIIEGAPDTETEDRDTYGRGRRAIRCAFVDKNARLQGFTLRGGYTANYDNAIPQSGEIGVFEDNIGGGVLMRGPDSGALVEDCIITDSWAAYGGGAAYAMLNRCQIIGNHADKGGSALRTSSAYNCLIDKNLGVYICHVPREIVNCTLGEGNRSFNGSGLQHCFVGGIEKLRVVNTLVLNDYHNAEYDLSTALEFRNVIANNSTLWVLPAHAENVSTNEYTQAQLMAMYDANCRPLTSEAASVDRGTDRDGVGELDIAGVQRVMNGGIDVGCYEYDWRGDYASGIAHRHTDSLAVGAVSSGVKMNDGTVTLSDGDFIEVDWTHAAHTDGKYVLDLVLAGTGALRIYLGGELLRTITAGGRISFQSAADVDKLRFEYASDNSGSAGIALMKPTPMGLKFIIQ